MAKRSDFERVEKDYYPSPLKAVEPLIPFLPDSFVFAEPCAGDGRLAKHLDYLTSSRALCSVMSDIEPRDAGIDKQDALSFVAPANTDFIITNPPWSRPLLHPMIERFSDQRPTWLLFDADWAHTVQAKPYLTRCSKIVAIGRVKWFEDSKHSGKDNACWYLFEEKPSGPTQFFGR